MKFSIPELKATTSATLVLRSLLDNGGPQPLSRSWFPGERVHRAAEVDALVKKLNTGMKVHNRSCRNGSRCRHPRHITFVTLETTELLTVVDGLDIAHMLLTAGIEFDGLKDKDRYEMLRHVRAVLFKCGANRGN